MNVVPCNREDYASIEDSDPLDGDYTDASCTSSPLSVPAGWRLADWDADIAKVSASPPELFRALTCRKSLVTLGPEINGDFPRHFQEIPAPAFSSPSRKSNLAALVAWDVLRRILGALAPLLDPVCMKHRQVFVPNFGSQVQIILWANCQDLSEPSNSTEALEVFDFTILGPNSPRWLV